jgi:hypothetical protein
MREAGVHLLYIGTVREIACVFAMAVVHLAGPLAEGGGHIFNVPQGECLEVRIFQDEGQGTASVIEDLFHRMVEVGHNDAVLLYVFKFLERIGVGGLAFRVRGKGCHEVPFMEDVEGTHGEQVASEVKAGLLEVGRVIIVAGFFPSVLEDRAFQGALAKILVLITDDGGSQGFAERV